MRGGFGVDELSPDEAFCSAGGAERAFRAYNGRTMGVPDRMETARSSVRFWMPGSLLVPLSMSSPRENAMKQSKAATAVVSGTQLKQRAVRLVVTL